MQLGLLLKDTLIDHLVVGGPAAQSKLLHQGDKILRVDGIAVTKDNILRHLIGSDIPGSTVCITVAKLKGEVTCTHNELE